MTSTVPPFGADQHRRAVWLELGAQQLDDLGAARLTSTRPLGWRSSSARTAASVSRGVLPAA